jgi:carbon monoxide dehydrogenase subunit G
MQLEEVFVVASPIEVVYETVLDVERVAGCVPGGTVLGRQSEDVYTAEIRLRIGPISLRYRGTVEVLERDPDTHRAVLRVSAREMHGQGTAEASAELLLTPDGDATRGRVAVDVTLSGRAASLGQGAIHDVSSRIVASFAENLEAMLNTSRPSQPGPADHEAQPEPPRPDTGGVWTRSSTRPGESADGALDVAGLAGSVIAERLRDPRVFAGLLLGAGAFGFLAGRLRR